MTIESVLAAVDEGRRLEAPFRVTDLKQWAYCPRILYYALCLPDVRPITFKMEAGIEAGRDEEGREARRSLKAYGIQEGQREFNVRVQSDRLGLRGVVDMVIWPVEDATKRGRLFPEIIPVDYKLSTVAGDHFKLQLAAYALLLEEQFGGQVQRSFLYSIPLRKAEEVKIDGRMRQKLLQTLDAMHRMLAMEGMPDATEARGRCAACEFRRFCNDVI